MLLYLYIYKIKSLTLDFYRKLDKTKSADKADLYLV